MQGRNWNLEDKSKIVHRTEKALTLHVAGFDSADRAFVHSQPGWLPIAVDASTNLIYQTLNSKARIA